MWTSTQKQGMSRNTIIAIRSSVIMTETVRLLSTTASHLRRQQRHPTNMNDLLVVSSRIGNRCIMALLTSHYIDKWWWERFLPFGGAVLTMLPAIFGGRCWPYMPAIFGNVVQKSTPRRWTCAPGSGVLMVANPPAWCTYIICTLLYSKILHIDLHTVVQWIPSRTAELPCLDEFKYQMR